MVEYLTRDTELGVTVASALKSEADHLASMHERTEPVLLDIVERYNQILDFFYKMRAEVKLNKTSEKVCD